MPTSPASAPACSSISRRRWLAASGAAVGAALAAAPSAAAPPGEPSEPFGYALNTSTIRGQGLSLREEVDIAARAGYQGIEPWIRQIDAYVQTGGSLADLRKRIADQGLVVVSAIGFAQWIVDDPAARAKGLEEMKRDMHLVAELGGRRIAAPPSGATRQPIGDLFAVAQRYRAVLELGGAMGVTPQLEIWGPSHTLGRLGEAALVAVESGHPDACILPDVYHIFRGGSDFAGLGVISAGAMHVFHVNDYPASPPRQQMTDADRVFPGDGVAPLGAVFRGLAGGGFRGMLSLELFNKTYWAMDAFEAARTGLEKTRASVAAALEDATAPPR